MTNRFADRIAEATRLTRSGRLAEATALLKSFAAGGDPAPERASDDDVIEGQATHVDPALRIAASPQPATPRTRRRPTLRETLATIAAGGMPAEGLSRLPGQRVPLPAVPLPLGATFGTHTHASVEGTREYKLYRPAAATAAAMPLVVMLHGCTQSPDDFAVGTGMNVLAEEFGCLVAWPAQPTGANANKCWNWFRPEDQGHGRGEPALIAGIVGDILRSQNADPGHVFVAGLSAGGAAALIVAAAYPEVFAAAGVHSGLPVGAARDVPGAFAAMRQGAPAVALPRGVRLISFHGDADATVHPANGAAVAAQARTGFGRLRAATDAGVSHGGRAWSRTRHRKPDGSTVSEEWRIAGAGHAWSGGDAAGTYTDPAGPDASRAMLRFFLSAAPSTGQV